MNCFKCGTVNSDDAKTCESCGVDLIVVPSDEATFITDSGQYLFDNFIINKRFKILRRVGKGGMGQVFLAEDVKLKRKVAIKSISSSSISDPTSKERFLREAQTASQLEHSNICPIYEIYEESENDYIVMQYIDGVTLDQIIKLKKLSINKIIDIAIQICNGMIEAHSKEIIHRDIKPANIIVDKKGIVKILDFGLAKIRDKAFVKQDGVVDSNLTEKGVVLGTVAYMSPEQARGKVLNHGTDIFSFGIILYEMLEGKNPFQDQEQIITLYNVLNKDVEFSVNIPDDLKQIVLKLLKKDKKHRFQSFSELKEALEEFGLLSINMKEKKSVGDQTEIINYVEKEKLLKEVQKTTDNEKLGDLVYKIKRLKAYTEPIFSSKRIKRKFVLIPLIFILVVFSVYYFLILNKKRGTSAIKDEGKDIYVYLFDLKNETGDRGLSEKVSYLLNESLNQFKEFKTINREVALPIAGDNKGKLDLNLLKKRFNIKFELKGEIKKTGGSYEIKVEPQEVGETHVPITVPGRRGKDGLLNHQIDSLTEQFYERFFPDKKRRDLKLKRVSHLYGTEWEKFSDFYKGLTHYKKLEFSEAIRYLEKAKDLLISKYFLADLYCFSGERKEASKLIGEVDKDLDKLTDSLRLRVLALKARLNFNFEEEVKILVEIKDDFKFSKGIFYALGEAHFHHGEAKKAIGYYKKALALDENYSLAINHMGYCYSHIGDHTEALKSFDRYKTLDDTANSYDSQGDGFFYKGDLNSAISCKETAIRLDAKGVYWAYLTIADVYILRALYDQANNALGKYRSIKKDKRNSARVLAKKAFIHHINRENERALETINESIKTFDSNDIKNETSEAHWLKGLILLTRDDVKESKNQLKWLNDFVEKYRLSKDNFSAPYKYFVHLEALILEKENEITEAENKFISLIKMKPQLSYQTTYYNYQFFHTEYADFLNRKTKFDVALSEINKCLEFNKKYIPALWKKAEILEKLNDPSRFEVYKEIAAEYEESDEKNYWRDRLDKKMEQGTQ